MKPIKSGLFILLITVFSACNSQKTDYKQQIDSEIRQGNFTAAKQIIDSVIETLSPAEKAELAFVKDSLHRVELDFRTTKDEIVSWVEQNRGFTPSDSLLSEWEKSKALEFRIIDGEKRYIPEYVLENRKGDCGQVALLLIAMLRYKGIPARWQSGWMVHPGEVNLHDWAEFYCEGIGWIPIDISFARGGKLNHPIGREFFMSGIDSYRLYVNSDYSGKFYPEKKFPRSETVDFQRGEVETSNWNLYFDEWDYHMEVEYLH